MIEANAVEAVSEAIKLQDEETVDESFGIESENAVDAGIDTAEERS